MAKDTAVAEKKDTETAKRGWPVLIGKSVGGFFRRLAKLLVTLLLCAALVALGAGGVYYLMSRESPVTVTAEVIGERLEDVGDLVSLEYYYKDVASIDKDKLSLAGLRIPFTSNRAIVTYEGVVKYGVSVRDLNISVEENQVTVDIPVSKIISHEMPEESVVVFDPGRNIFNPVTIEDFVQFKADRKAEIVQQTEERGLPRDAQIKAGETLRAILESLPGMENYQLVITYEGT